MNQFIETIANTHQGKTQVNLIWFDGKLAVSKNTDSNHEILALQTLQHPNICKLIKIDENIITMEFVKGMPLHRLLQNVKKLEKNYVCLIILQILDTLQFIHQNGWLYRDLKASNILVLEEGKVKLIDFGLSINKLTATEYCGTLHAMSPSVIQQKEYNYKSDLYSLGILFFELLQGHPPFGYDGEDLKQKILQGIQEHHLNQIDDVQIRQVIKNLLQEQIDYDEIRQILKDPYYIHESIYDEEIYFFTRQYSYDEEECDDIF